MMSRNSIIVASIGGVLLLCLASEVDDAIGVFSVLPPDTAATAAAVASSSPAPASRPTAAAQTSTILTRPLFNWNRQAAHSAGTIDGPLPRLSGIVVGADDRYAIFAAQQTGKPMIVREGGSVGRFTIDSIAADHIVLKSGTGTQQLQTHFAPAAPPPLATPDAS